MSMAIKYAMAKKAKKMAEGGMTSCQCGEAGCPKCSGVKMAEGGDVDLIDRIMRKRGEPVADFESNDFDVMDELEPGDEANYTGANSGDEVGNDSEDADRRDIVARIMRSRAKRDRLPRPA